MAEKNMNAKISVEFEETANRQQVATGDSLSTLFSKVKKFFSDLKTVAFSGSYNDLSDVPVIDDTLSTESTNAIQNKAVAGALQNVNAKTVDTQTLTAPNGFTPFYPSFVDSNNTSATAEALKTNDAYIFQMKGGTAEAEGTAQLILGNTKLAGTDGNMKGQLVFFNNANGYYVTLNPNTAITNNATFTLPATGGTLALDLSKAKLTENSEGGNLRLTSPDGTLYMEQDCYNNNMYRCYAVKDGATKAIWYYDSVNNVYRVYPVAAFVNARMAMQMQSVTKGSNPTATQYARLQFVDNSGSVTDAATVAMIYASVDTSGNTHLSIGAANNVASTWTPYVISVNYNKGTGGYAQVSAPYSQSLSCLRNIAAGTAAATTSNCPNGALYGQYS